jgi:hypothetical protein
MLERGLQFTARRSLTPDDALIRPFILATSSSAKSA